MKTFFTTEKLSAKRHKTPEGYLVIEGTPIARTGTQIYAPEELGNNVEPDADGMVRIHRRPEEVFKADSMASWNGKAMTNDHPDDLLDSMTTRGQQYGTVLNPRKGTGDEEDLLLVDLIIYDQGMITLIDAGKTELSCGYNPEYAEFEPGKWEQRNIIGNHVALVAEGRCGPRCAIRDHKHEESTTMPKTYADRLMKLLGVKDRAALQVALDAELPEVEPSAADEGGGGANEMHVHLHNGNPNGATTGGAADEEEGDPMVAMGRRMDGLENMMKDVGAYIKGQRDKETMSEKSEDEEAEEAEEMDEEGGEKAAKDSISLGASWTETVGLAEIIMPGLTPPTFDGKAKPKVSLDTICNFRRKVLDLAYSNAAGRQAIEELNGGKTFDAKCATCDKIRNIFRGVGAAMKRHNNNGGNRMATTIVSRDQSVGINSVSELSRRAAQLFH